MDESTAFFNAIRKKTRRPPIEDDTSLETEISSCEGIGEMDEGESVFGKEEY